MPADPNTFRIHARLSAWKSADRDALKIGGIVSTDCLDRQSEKVLQDGLDFDDFLTHGWFNDNHKSGTGDVVGYPKGVRRIKPGDKLPDGQVSTVNGWWADGHLLDTPKGREIHELARSLEGTERSLGFSIEGTVEKRKGQTITAAKIRNVAVTHCPVNPETNLIALAKAMMAGDAVAAPAGDNPGDGFALRTETLDGKKKKPKADLVKDDETDEEEPAPVAKAAVLTDVPAMTTTALVEEWAMALASSVRDMGDPDAPALTKSEAAIVASLKRRVTPHTQLRGF